MYQLVAGQGRQWKLYSKALDCYRKGVRLALAKKDMTTADMAFTNMTTLADVVGEFANTKKEWVPVPQGTHEAQHGALQV